MTTQESTHILSYYAAQLMHTCHCYVKDPVSGEVKLENTYVDLIDAMRIAVDCIEATQQ